MKSKILTLPVILVISITLLVPQIHAESSVSIIMEQTTYTYCEKLFYIIEVSEITGEPAIIHIRDETGKGSSAVPIQITSLQNPIPSLIAFQAETFPLGKYFIDVEYSGVSDTAEFELIESDSICIPELIKPVMVNWITGKISDGFLIDAFQRYVDSQLIYVPFEIDEGNVYDIDIPEWIKNIGYWWIEGVISDDDFSKAMNYLLAENIIGFPTSLENEI
ncbi:hypothetical protein [Nitrosopumilus sp.]|uniref:hypothetical protein n=1 Tax=Nitrosopumilus sp. TaxID=2024843 RepID=UPI0034A031DC